MSQATMILNHMRIHGGITSMEAFTEYGITRLSGRIFDLRRAGYNIIDIERSEKNRFGERTKFVEYRLGKSDG